jgi:hypothetical protein
MELYVLGLVLVLSVWLRLTLRATSTGLSDECRYSLRMID